MATTSEQFYKSLGFEAMSQLKTDAQNKEELVYLKSHLKNRQHILDLGCGYGRFTIPLAVEGFDIEGLDLSPELIAKASDLVKEHKVNVKFTIGDMRSLQYKENEFDSIICMWNTFSELFEFKDQIKAVKEMLRVLRKEGFAFIEVRNHLISGVDREYLIEGIKGMPSFKHTKRSLKALMIKLDIDKYKIFTDKFGGRNRLFLKFWK